MTEVKSIDVLRAIMKGSIEQLNAFIKRGVDFSKVTDKEKWTYLHRATMSVSPSMPINITSLKFLIDQGLDVNALDCYGNSALQYASRVKNIEAMKLLIKAGSDINTKNIDSITPLQHTLSQKPYVFDAVEVLLSNGANPDHPLPSGEKTIRGLVNTICHGEDIAIKELFDKF